jgi:hypothetical protein
VKISSNLLSLTKLVCSQNETDGYGLYPFSKATYIYMSNSLHLEKNAEYIDASVGKKLIIYQILLRQVNINAVCSRLNRIRLTIYEECFYSCVKEIIQSPSMIQSLFSA